MCPPGRLGLDGDAERCGKLAVAASEDHAPRDNEIRGEQPEPAAQGARPVRRGLVRRQLRGVDEDDAQSSGWLRRPRVPAQLHEIALLDDTDLAPRQEQEGHNQQQRQASDGKTDAKEDRSAIRWRGHLAVVRRCR